MQRVFNVDRWTLVEDKQSLEFLNPKPRNVRLEVNSPSEVALWYVDQATGETHFLALVKGRDVVTFGSTGPFEITVNGGFVMIATADGDDVSMKPTAENAYVKIRERRPRNPELEHIAALMQYNMQRNLEMQAHELERTFARRMAAIEEAQSQAIGTGAHGNAGTQQPSTGTAGEGSTGGETNGTTTNSESAASGAAT